MPRHDFRKHRKVWEFRVPTEDDIRYVAEHMREADRKEVKRMNGLDPESALRMSIGASKVCYAATIGKGEVCCIFGGSCSNLCDGTAILWMLSSDVIDRRPYEFAVASLAGVDRVCQEMPETAEFGNFVDTEYMKAMKWVEWFGGQFTNTTIEGMCGGKFRFFVFANPYYKKED